MPVFYWFWHCPYCPNIIWEIPPNTSWNCFGSRYSIVFSRLLSWRTVRAGLNQMRASWHVDSWVPYISLVVTMVSKVDNWSCFISWMLQSQPLQDGTFYWFHPKWKILSWLSAWALLLVKTVIMNGGVEATQYILIALFTLIWIQAASLWLLTYAQRWRWAWTSSADSVNWIFHWICSIWMCNVWKVPGDFFSAFRLSKNNKMDDAPVILTNVCMATEPGISRIERMGIIQDLHMNDWINKYVAFIEWWNFLFALACSMEMQDLISNMEMSHHLTEACLWWLCQAYLWANV